MGCVPPLPGFLQGLRDLCDAHGALLIFDEVMTGFRLAAGGAQQRFDVRPDLTTMGKVLGGGLPLGAYGGREDLMRLIAPDGPVYQAGTLSGNPLATAAGLATLGHLSAHPEVYERLEALGERLADGMRAVIAAGDGTAKWPLTWNQVGSMGSLFFTAGPVTDWTSSSAADEAAFARYFAGMLGRGIYLAPSPYEAGFVSAAHTEEDIDRTVEAARETLREVFDR
jgi:glutamate-1-semialdehyde 2,1-aminomutase